MRKQLKLWAQQYFQMQCPPSSLISSLWNRKILHSIWKWILQILSPFLLPAHTEDNLQTTFCTGFCCFFFVFSCWQTFRPLWYWVISRPTSVILNMGGNGPSLDRSQQYHWERRDYMKFIFFPILEFTFHLQSVFMIRSPCTNLPFYCFH